MKKILPITIILAGLSALYPMQRWIDAEMPREVVSEETLFFANGETIKKMSLGLEGLVADVYWIRTVQYFGRKLLEREGIATDTRKVRMDLLRPLLEIVVTLDPQNIPAYRFGAIFLPERDLPGAIELLERGIRENPGQWRLYQDLGYIYWQSGDYEKAAEIYERGGSLPEAPWWMRDLAGLMKIKGGSREVARVVYEGYLDNPDENIRNQAVARLKQLRALDEIDAINGLLERVRRQTGRCPQSLRPLARELAAMGMALNEELWPVDPDGVPYAFDAAECKVQLHQNSKIPL